MSIILKKYIPLQTERWWESILFTFAPFGEGRMLLAKFQLII